MRDTGAKPCVPPGGVGREPAPLPRLAALRPPSAAATHWRERGEELWSDSQWWVPRETAVSGPPCWGPELGWPCALRHPGDTGSAGSHII